MPLKKVWTGIAHLAFSRLGLFRRRVYSYNPEEGSDNSFTGGDRGATGVYKLGSEHVIAINTGQREAITTVVYPESVAPQVEAALNNAEREWSAQKEKRG